MKKKSIMSLLVTNVIVAVVIISGFAWTVYQDSTSYYQLVKEQLESVVRLASTNAYAQIDEDLTKPLMVSRTMANDAFLVEWAHDESIDGATDEQLSRLTTYLNDYYKEYQYNTIFFVSDKSKKYYYQEGVHKTISKDDSHDQWYFSFKESNTTVSMELDTDESEGNSLTFFLNYNVKDSDGNSIGVIGVGYQISDIIEKMEWYEKNYELMIYLVGNERTVKNNSSDKNNFVTEEEFYSIVGDKSEIELAKDSDFKLYWGSSKEDNKCMVVKYLDNLDWYLVIEKDMNTIETMFLDNIYRNIKYIVIVVLLCLMITTGIFRYYHNELVRRENTDELTGLMNRKHFELVVKKFRKKKSVKSLFIFDIDRFKSVNDTYGHNFGDEVLAFVGKVLQKSVTNYGIVARWGGDEFCGILAGDAKMTEKILRDVMSELALEEERLGLLITICCGIVTVDDDTPFNILFEKADKALYQSKKRGTNQISEYRDKI